MKCDSVRRRRHSCATGSRYSGLTIHRVRDAWRLNSAALPGQAAEEQGGNGEEAGADHGGDLEAEQGDLAGEDSHEQEEHPQSHVSVLPLYCFEDSSAAHE